MKSIAITAGDPKGVGPEIIIKALSDPRVKKAARPVIIGDMSVFPRSFLKKYAHINTAHLPLPASAAPSVSGGLSSFKAVRAAVNLALAGKVHAVVTAPISKQSWALAKLKYTGHTEYLLEAAGKNGEVLMMFSASSIKCALVTEHLPLKSVPGSLTTAKITAKTTLFHTALKAAGIKRPRIALAALNPHAGDNGKLGAEENRIILPAVKKLRARKINAALLPVDAAWLKHRNKEFDGVICMYHDAALLGLKLAAQETPVHITYGLKIIRTSPAHGTAFDIAGKNKADAEGMVNAILTACKMK